MRKLRRWPMALCALGTGRGRLTSQRSGRRTLLVLPAIAGLALVISACQTIPAPPPTTTTTTAPPPPQAGVPGWGPPAKARLRSYPPNPFQNVPAQTGWYDNQSTLTTTLPAKTTMAKKFDTQVDGQVYSSPVVDAGAGPGFGVLFVATENDKVYCLDPHSRDTGPSGSRPRGAVEFVGPGL